MLFLIIFTIVAAVIALGGLFVLMFAHVVFCENRNSTATVTITPEQAIEPTREHSREIVASAA